MRILIGDDSPVLRMAVTKLLEPEGYVVWEGFPLLKGYELTHKIVENVLRIAKEDMQ